jgi:predicted AAA+ superfamily ATPase
VGTYPQVGALFESFIVNQITALLGSLKEKVNLYHWRIQSGAEVDIIIEKDNVLYPIEVKSKTVLSKKDGRGIQSFRDAYPHKHIAPGVILYPGNHCFYVAENLIAVPCHGLFEENSL